MKIGKVFLGTKQGYNVIIINNTVLIVQNVVVVNGMVRLICQRFTERVPFFEYPTNSLDLKIATVNNLCVDLIQVSLPNDDIMKAVLLPHAGHFLCLPLRFCR